MLVCGGGTGNGGLPGAKPVSHRSLNCCVEIVSSVKDVGAAKLLKDGGEIGQTLRGETSSKPTCFGLSGTEAADLVPSESVLGKS